MIELHLKINEKNLKINKEMVQLKQYITIKPKFSLIWFSFLITPDKLSEVDVDSGLLIWIGILGLFGMFSLRQIYRLRQRLKHTQIVAIVPLAIQIGDFYYRGVIDMNDPSGIILKFVSRGLGAFQQSVKVKYKGIEYNGLIEVYPKCAMYENTKLYIRTGYSTWAVYNNVVSRERLGRMSFNLGTPPASIIGHYYNINIVSYYQPNAILESYEFLGLERDLEPPYYKAI